MDDGYGNFKKLPTDNKQKVNEYVDEANNVLPEYNKRIVNDKFYNLLRASVVLLLLVVAIGGWFGYMAYEDKFKTELSCPEISIPECPSCPNNPCEPVMNCGDCTFPEDLNINLINQTG